MSTFISTGVYTKGCIIPITTEEPSLIAILDDFSEEFRINIYAGSYLESITMKNYRTVCNDLLRFPCVDRFGKYISSIKELIEEQMFYDYLRIHNKI